MATFTNLENAHVFSKAVIRPNMSTDSAANISAHTVQSKNIWAEPIPFLEKEALNGIVSDTVFYKDDGLPIVKFHYKKNVYALINSNNNDVVSDGFVGKIIIDGKPIEQFISPTDVVNENGKMSIIYQPSLYDTNGKSMPLSDYIINCSNGLIYDIKSTGDQGRFKGGDDGKTNYTLSFFTYEGLKADEQISNVENKVSEHLSANGIHVTEEDRENWNSISGEMSAKIAEHVNDDTIHITEESSKKWDDNIEATEQNSELISGLAITIDAANNTINDIDSSLQEHVKNNAIHITEESSKKWDDNIKATKQNKEDILDLEEDITSINASIGSLEQHVNDNAIHITEESSKKWNDNIEATKQNSDLISGLAVILDATKDNLTSFINDVDSSLEEHVNNDTIHISEASSKKWDDNIDATNQNSALLQQHVNDNAIHITEESSKKWNDNIEATEQNSDLISGLAVIVDNIEQNVEEITEKLEELNVGVQTSKLNISNLDDDDGETPLESFTNLNKINFVGRFVNISSNAEGEITVYINEDNSLPSWNKTANFSPATESRYIYGVPAGSSLSGNNSYDYVATTPGIHDLTINYSGSAFSLSKHDYKFKVTYKVNGAAAEPIIVSLEDYITNERLETSEYVSFEEENLILTAKKLGNDVLNEGKTPGSLEVENFSYTLSKSLLAEGAITDITVAFIHDIATDYVLASPKKIYLWTVKNDKPAAEISSLKLTPNFTKYRKISGLKYVDSEDSENTVAIELTASNIASGSLKSNKISLSQSSSQLSLNSTGINTGFTIQDTNKAHSKTFSKSVALSAQSKRGTLTVEASIPNPTGNNTTLPTTTGSAYSLYNIAKASTINTENFYDESYRKTSSWGTWNSENALVSGEAVVQYGKLYHTNPDASTKWVDAETSGGSAANYKSLDSKSCSYYRTFSASGTNKQTSIFYIGGDGVSDIFNKPDKVEVRVWQYDGQNWESGEGWIANKISTELNDGLASSTLSNGKIVCSLKKNTGSGKPESGGTYINKGIRMQIKIKDTSTTVHNLTVTF